ncbi:MAG: hypothetical protein PHF00_14050 [Elusimicrobia bacterium]|nr:hypothetical protein [Elusimicrobiota bacterium]
MTSSALRRACALSGCLLAVCSDPAWAGHHSIRHSIKLLRHLTLNKVLIVLALCLVVGLAQWAWERLQRW